MLEYDIVVDTKGVNHATVDGKKTLCGRKVGKWFERSVTISSAADAIWNELNANNRCSNCEKRL